MPPHFFPAKHLGQSLRSRMGRGSHCTQSGRQSVREEVSQRVVRDDAGAPREASVEQMHLLLSLVIV